MSYFPVFTSYILYQIVSQQQATIKKNGPSKSSVSVSSLHLYKAADKVCFSWLDNSGNSIEICFLSF